MPRLSAENQPIQPSHDHSRPVRRCDHFDLRAHQITVWFPEAYPLNLPAYCLSWMANIWRSCVAQRICWENNWPLLFSPSSVYQ